MALISPERPRRASRRPRSSDRRRPLGPWSARRGRVAYDAGHLPGAIFLDLDTASDGAGRSGPPSPALPGRLHGDARRGRDRRSAHFVVAYDDVGGWVASRLWWMLDERSDTTKSPCSTAAIRPGSPRACRRRPTCRSTRRPRSTSAIVGRHDRSRRAAGAPRRRRPARRPRRAALPRRDRADRPRRRPHPDRAQRSDRRQPRRGRPVPAARRARGAVPCAGRRRIERGRDLVRQRRLGDAQRARDAGRGPARPDPLCRLLERLVDSRLPRGDRPGARPATGSRRVSQQLIRLIGG